MNDFDEKQELFPDLTDKQECFVAEYLVDFNATAAAKRAGYSENSASEIGYQLLQKTSVQTAVRQAVEDRAKRTNLKQDQVVQELCQVAFSPASDASDSDMRYASKLRALELLGKHLGLFTEQVVAEVKQLPPPIPLSRRRTLLLEIADQIRGEDEYGNGDDEHSGGDDE